MQPLRAGMPIPCSLVGKSAGQSEGLEGGYGEERQGKVTMWVSTPLASSVLKRHWAPG